jgi:hypothetical protein
MDIHPKGRPPPEMETPAAAGTVAGGTRAAAIIQRGQVYSAARAFSRYMVSADLLVETVA